MKENVYIKVMGLRVALQIVLYHAVNDFIAYLHTFHLLLFQCKKEVDRFADMIFDLINLSTVSFTVARFFWDNFSWGTKSKLSLHENDAHYVNR